MGLREDLQAELKAAMRRRDTAVVAGLRVALGALANAEAAPQGQAGPPGGIPQLDTLPMNDQRPATSAAPTQQPFVGNDHFAGSVAGLGAAEVQRLTLTDAEERRILAAEIAQLDEHAARLTAVCRYDEADGARRAARTLEVVLKGVPD